MSSLGKVVLKEIQFEDSSDRYILGFHVIEKPNNEENTGVVNIGTPSRPIDGFYLTNTFRFLSGCSIEEGEVLGIIPDRKNVEQKTYEIAKRYAQNLAASNNFEFMDETNRLKESPLVAV